MELEGGKAGVEMPEVAELLDEFEWIPKSTWSAAEAATAPDSNPSHAAALKRGAARAG